MDLIVKVERWNKQEIFASFHRPVVYFSVVKMCVCVCMCVQVEEGKLVRVQLELAQVKADIDRRIHEKEEEFEVTRWENTHSVTKHV